jgi:hypothetical protein
LIGTDLLHPQIACLLGGVTEHLLHFAIDIQDGAGNRIVDKYGIIDVVEDGPVAGFGSFEGFLLQLPGGDVLKQTMSPQKSSLLVENDPAVKGGDDSGAVLANHLPLDAADLLDGLEAGETFRKEVLIGGLQESAETAAQHFLPGISQKVQPGLIHL